MATATIQEIEALQKYAKAKGRYWKSKLYSDWLNGRASGVLQQIRNTRGPVWLTNFRFPKAGA